MNGIQGLSRNSSKRSCIINILVVFSIIFASIIISFYASDNPFSIGNMARDSAVYKYIAMVIRNGGMPYRDSFDHKGPLLYIFNYLGIVLSDDYGVFVLELINMIVVNFFLYKIGRLIGCGRVTSCCILAIPVSFFHRFFDGGNMVEEWALPYVVISLYIFLNSFSSQNRDSSVKNIIISGFCFGCVSLLRINMVVLWGVFSVWIIVACAIHNEFLKICKFIIWFLLGVIIACGPIIVWLYLNDSFYDFLRDYFVFNISYSNVPFREIAKSFYVFFMNKWVLSAYFICLYFAITEKKMMDLQVLICLSLHILFSSISGQIYNHYGIILVPFVFYAYAKLGKEISAHIDINKRNIKVCVALCFCFIILYNSWTIVGVLRKIRGGVPSYYMDYRDEIANVIQNNTNSDETIAVVGNDDYIYIAANRFSFSVFSYQYPLIDISDELYKSWMRDLKTKKPKIIVFPSVLSSDSNYSFIEEEYQCIDSVEDYYIYLKR